MSCDSKAPQLRSAQSNSTRVIKGNHHKMNRRKTRPYCVYISRVFYSTEYKTYVSLFTVISITKEHKNMKNCLPVHNARLVKKVHGQNNLCCVELCLVLLQTPNPGQQGIKSTSFQVLHRVAQGVLQKVTQLLAIHTNIQTASLIILNLDAVRLPGNCCIGCE